MSREDVYKLIDGERAYQDSKWNENTTTSKGLHTPDEFTLYMQQLLNEAQAILSHESNAVAWPKALEIIRKVTALGVSCMEQHDTLPRKM